MGYDGIVITDSMVMGAISAHFDPIDAAVMAINAGADILLCPVNLYQGGGVDTFPEFDMYMRKLLARIRNGDVDIAELDDSVTRILKLKMEKGMLEETEEVPLKEQIAAAEAVVGAPEHHRAEWEMTMKALTLLKNDGGVLPLDGSREQKILLLIPSENHRPTVEYALSRLKGEGLLEKTEVTVLNYAPLYPEDEELAKAVKEANVVLAMSQSSVRDVGLVWAMEQAHDGHKPVALLSLNLPYNASSYEEADAVLCAYQAFGIAYDEQGRGPFNLNVAAALYALFGDETPAGTLPVNVPGRDGGVLYERGFGLTNWGQ